MNILGYDARTGRWRVVPDREHILTVLRKRFAEATPEQLAAAANAIIGLGAEWREVEAFEQELLPYLPVDPPDPDSLPARLRSGRQFKLFERLPPESSR